MARYINADKVERSLVFLGDTQYEQDIKKAVLQLLQVQPTADVKDVVRGEWIKSKTDGGEIECVCSRCRGDAPAEYGRYTWIKSDICPNCGAAMRGGVE